MACIVVSNVRMANDSYYDHQNGQDGHPNNQAGCIDNQDYLQYW